MTAGHAHGANGIIMRRPDGTPMSRNEVIVRRRGAFHWLPTFFSNDLVHGSWWFVMGSGLTALSGVYPLMEKYVMSGVQEDDVLPAMDFDITWVSIILCGVFFALGSLAFVRAFEEPPRQALFFQWKHLQTDELLGAWFFLLGTAPSIPYTFVFFTINPSAFYFFAFCGSIVFTLGTGLFVKGSYPNDRKRENYILPIFLRINGAQMWAVKHLANDWLAGCWFFLWGNVLLTFVSFLMLLVALGVNNSGQIFIWLSGTVCSFFFLVGSLYFVCGSYPHAQQFYYVTGRSEEDVADERFDEMGLLPDEAGVQAGAAPTGKVYRIVYNQPLPPPIQRAAFKPWVALLQARSNAFGLERADPERQSLVSSASLESVSADVANPLHAPLSPVLEEVGADTTTVAVAADEPLVATTTDTVEAPAESLATQLQRRESIIGDDELARLISSIEENIHREDENRDDDDDEAEEDRPADLIRRSISVMHTMRSLDDDESPQIPPLPPQPRRSLASHFPAVEEAPEEVETPGGADGASPSTYVVVGEAACLGGEEEEDEAL